MEGIISLYIKIRMKAMGFKNFHLSLEPVTIKHEQIVARVDAHNEFWYLFDVNQTDDNFTISANNNIINRDEFVVDGVPFITYEFTGDIKIENQGAHADQTFLFYRVIPQ